MQNSLEIKIPDIPNPNTTDYIPSSILNQMQPKSPHHIVHVPLNLLSPRKVLDSRTHSIFLSGKVPRRPDNAWNNARASKRFSHLRSLRPLDTSPKSARSYENEIPEISPPQIHSARETSSNTGTEEFTSPSLQPTSRDQAIYLKRMMNNLIAQLPERPKFEVDDFTINVQELFTNILTQLTEEEQVYDVCFDEIIRQVTIECRERGEIINSLRNRMASVIQYLLKSLQFSFNQMRLSYDHVHKMENTIKENEITIDKQQKELCYLGDVLKKVRLERDKLHEDLLTERKQKEMDGKQLVKLKHLSKYADIALKKLSSAITIQSLMRGYLERKKYEKMLAIKHAKKALKENDFIASKDGGLHVLHTTKETEYLEENKLDEDDDGYRPPSAQSDEENGKSGIQISYEKVQKQARLESKSAFLIQKAWAMYKSKKGVKKVKKIGLFEFEKIPESDIKPLPSALIPECEEQTTFEKVQLKEINQSSASNFKPLNIKTTKNSKGRRDKNGIISNQSSIQQGDSVCEYNTSGKVIKGGENYVKPDMIEVCCSPIIWGKKSPKNCKVITTKYVSSNNGKVNSLARPVKTSRSNSNSRSNSRKSSLRKRRISPNQDYDNNNNYNNNNKNYCNNNNVNDDNESDDDEYNENDENIEYNPSKQYNKKKNHHQQQQYNNNNDNIQQQKQQLQQNGINNGVDNNKYKTKSGHTFDSNIPAGEYMELNDTAVPNRGIRYDGGRDIDLMSPGEMLEHFEKKLRLLNELLRNSENSTETKNQMFPQIKAVEKQIQRLKAPFYNDSDNKFSGWKEGIDEVKKATKQTTTTTTTTTRNTNGRTATGIDSFSSEINDDNEENEENAKPREPRKPRGKAFKWPKVLHNDLTNCYFTNKIDVYSEGLHIRGPTKMNKLLEFIRTTLDDLANSEFNKFMLTHRAEGTIGNGVIEVEQSLFEDDKVFTLKKDLDITQNEFKRVMSGDNFEIDEYSNYTRLGDIIYKIFHSKYGFKKLVDQHIVDLIYSLCTYREMNEEINFFSEMLEESISPRDLSRILHIRRLCRLISDGFIFSNTEGEYNKEYLSFERVSMTIRALFGLSKSDDITDHPIEPMLRRIKDITKQINIFGKYIKNNDETWISMTNMIKSILDEYRYQDKSKYQQKWIICRFIQVDNDKDGFINRDEFLESLEGIEPSFDKREMSLLFGNITKSIGMNDMTLNSYRNTMKSLLDEIGDNVNLPSLNSSSYAAEANFKTYSVSLAMSKLE